MMSATGSLKLGNVLPWPRKTDVIYEYDGPRAWISSNGFGEKFFVFCINDEGAGSSYAVVNVMENEGAKLADGTGEIRPHLEEKTVGIARDVEEGIMLENFRKLRFDELPKHLTTFSVKGTREIRKASAVREGFRTALAQGVMALQAVTQSWEWLAEGRGAYAWDEPCLFKELLDINERVSQVLDDIRACVKRGRDMLVPIEEFAQKELHEEITLVEEEALHLGVISEALSAPARDGEMPDEKIRTLAAAMFEAVEKSVEVLKKVAGSRTGCP